MSSQSNPLMQAFESHLMIYKTCGEQPEHLKMLIRVMFSTMENCRAKEYGTPEERAEVLLALYNLQASTNSKLEQQNKRLSDENKNLKDQLMKMQLDIHPNKKP